MANIIPVSSMVQPPANVVGNFQQGMQLGQQQRQQREQRLDQQNLRNLAPQVIAGDAGAFQEAAAINPEAAGQYQQAGDSQLRRLKGFVDYVNKARQTAQQTGDMRHVNAALQQAAPYVSQLLGKPAPTEWSPDMEPGWSQLEAQIAMAEGGGQGTSILSTYVDDQGQRVAVKRDGTTQVLGGADLGASQQTISVAGPDGRPRQYTFDRRTGNYVPAEMSGGQPQGQQPGPQGAPQQMQQSGVPGYTQAPLPQGGGQAFVDDSLALANQMIAAGIPEAQVDAFLQARMNPAGGTQPQHPVPAPQQPDFSRVTGGVGSGAPTPQQGEGAGGSQFVGRSPEEQARLTRQAEIDTDLANADALAEANIPPGYRRTDEGGLEPIPGSAPAHTREQDERQARLGRERAQRLGTVVVQDMDRALQIMDDQPNLGGGTLAAASRVAQSRIPGNPWYAMRNHVESAKDTISLENLQGLKEASGAGLGNVSEKQTTLLSHAYGSINLAADNQTLRDALTRTRNIYLDIIFGHGDGPERKPLSYQDKWEPVDEGWVDGQGRPLSTFGAADRRSDTQGQVGGVDDLLNKYGVR